MGLKTKIALAALAIMAITNVNYVVQRQQTMGALAKIEEVVRSTEGNPEKIVDSIDDAIEQLGQFEKAAKITVPNFEYGLVLLLDFSLFLPTPQTTDSFFSRVFFTHYPSLHSTNIRFPEYNPSMLMPSLDPDAYNQLLLLKSAWKRESRRAR